MQPPVRLQLAKRPPPPSAGGIPPSVGVPPPSVEPEDEPDEEPEDEPDDEPDEDPDEDPDEEPDEEPDDEPEPEPEDEPTPPSNALSVFSADPAHAPSAKRPTMTGAAAKSDRATTGTSVPAGPSQKACPSKPGRDRASRPANAGSFGPGCANRGARRNTHT